MDEELRSLRERVGSVAQRVEVQLDVVSEQAAVLGEAPSRARFTEQTLIADAWSAHPEAPRVFAEHHLPHCNHCPLSRTEPVGVGARDHGLDPAALLADLNALS